MLSGERKKALIVKVRREMLVKEALSLNPLKWLGTGASKATAAPVNAVGRGIKRFFFGAEQAGGRYAGTRLAPTGKHTQISQSEFLRLQREAKLPQGTVKQMKGGKEVEVAGPIGHKVPEVFKKEGPQGMGYYKYDYKPGGLVGTMMKHPLMTAGVGGIGYLLLKNKQNASRYGGRPQQPQQAAPQNNQMAPMATQNPWG